MKSRITMILIAVLALMFSLTASAQSSKSTCCDLKSDMRVVWEDHIVWTRNVILNIIDELPGTTEAVNRLLQNQTDIGNAIKPYYGNAAGNQLTVLLRDHIFIAADILNALDDGNTAALNTAIAAWYVNADDIAAFLSSANPNWPLQEMKTMMRDHLDATTAEAVARKNGNYAADVAAYDEVHRQILHMADMLTEGITKQFPQMFNGCAGARNNHNMNPSTMAPMLGQSAPNPAQGFTTIPYYIPGFVRQAVLNIYDQNGNTVKTIDIRNRGEGSLQIDLSSFNNGLYRYSLFADGQLAGSKTLIR